MYIKNIGFSAALATILSFQLIPAWGVLAQGTVPSHEEMWRIIQQQQKEIQALKQKLNMVEKDVATTEERIEVIADSPVVDRGPSWADKTTVGGYGEMHFNSLTNTTKGGGGDKSEIDFHRFVMFFGHQFNDRVRFFSELEVEHGFLSDSDTDTNDDTNTDTVAGSVTNPNPTKPDIDTSDGELELEQAYVDIDLTDNHTLRAGQFLIPVGILNETHEPPTFYGVERNDVEKRIIPATWWAGGLSLHGQLIPESGLSYDLAYTSGLAVNSKYEIRSGRQKVSKAKADKGAVTARLKWNMPGLELATTYQHQSDLTQGGSNGAAERASADLWEIHTIIEKGRFGLRALYAQWTIDSQTASDLGADHTYGWYVEPSMKLRENFGIFARYGAFDQTAGDKDKTNSKTTQFNAGFNWWPHENVVLKADYQRENIAPHGKTQRDGFNLGVGYQF